MDCITNGPSIIAIILKKSTLVTYPHSPVREYSREKMTAYCKGKGQRLNKATNMIKSGNHGGIDVMEIIAEFVIQFTHQNSSM